MMRKKAILSAYFVWVGLCNIALKLVQGGRYSVHQLPTLSSTDSIEFYYTETSLPYNTPIDIVDTAGLAFVEYATTHAGIGIWDTTTGLKMTVQLVSDNFVGALLPTLEPIAGTDTGYIYFNNSASIIVTNPLQDDDWISSRHVGSGSGIAYADLVSYLQALTGFEQYQPITVVRPSPDDLINTSDVFMGDTDNGIGTVVIPAVNSYSFVNAVFTNLADFGLDLDAFLQGYATSFSYLTNDTVIEKVTWSGQAKPEVYQWFNRLNQCYSQAYANTALSNGGADYFLAAITDCYGEYAYVYAGSNSVYNVSLFRFSDYKSPVLYRYQYNVPTGNGDVGIVFTALDYVVIAVLFFSIFIATLYFAYLFIAKPQRRRISFEGQRIVEKAVEATSITSSERNTLHFYGSSPSSQASAGALSRMLTLSAPKSREGSDSSLDSPTSRSLRDSTDTGVSPLQRNG